MARAAKHSKAVVDEAEAVSSPAAPVAVAAAAAAAVVTEPAIAEPVIVTPVAVAEVPVEAPVATPVATPVVSMAEAIANDAIAVENVVSAQVVTVSQDEIARLAYSYWVERGYQGGNPQEDWARAEQALLAVCAA